VGPRDGLVPSADRGRSEPAAGAYDHFSDAEMDRRARAIDAMLEANELGCAVLYGAERSGSAVQWATEWPVTREAALVWPAGGPATLLVQFHNHVPNASRMARNAEVAWGGASTIESVAALLGRERRGDRRIGVIGPLPASAGQRIARDRELVFLDSAYARLRARKSTEELEWLRKGVELTDVAVEALARGAAVGMTEAELCDLVERAYIGRGGTNHIHYLAATSMTDPSVAVPAQWPSRRALSRGDALVCEVSASYWGYPGQLLRSFAVGCEPTEAYRDLHDIADEAFSAIASALVPGATARDLERASAPIVAAGLTSIDDLVHGFVGGYLEPVVGRAPRPVDLDTFVLEKDMTIVVQPNVVSTDGASGVQTGELLLVGEHGAERVHRFPRGFATIGVD